MKVLFVGLGGFGINLINDLKCKLDETIDMLVIANNDVLENADITNKIGLHEDINIILDFFDAYQKIIIANGLGSNSSKKLIPIVDNIKDEKDLEVIVNKPFNWEGGKRGNLADLIIKKLVDENIVTKIYDNNSLLDNTNDNLPIEKIIDSHDKMISKYILKKCIENKKT